MDNSIAAPNCSRKVWTLEDIEASISSHSIVVFLKGTAREPKCGFSARVVSLLEKHGLDYHSVDVSKSKGLAAALSVFSGEKQTPLVYVNGVIASCNDALEQMLCSLDSLGAPNC